MAEKTKIGGHIIIHIWDAAWLSGSPGHAAIHIGNRYISFWPGTQTGKLSWSGFKLKTYKEDLTTYAATKQAHWCAIIPNDDGGKHGLNKQAMLDKWAAIQSSKPDYTTKVHCSGVVNQLLLAGGSQNYAATSLVSWSSWYIYAVSPSDLRDYCEILIPKINRANR